MSFLKSLFVRKLISDGKPPGSVNPASINGECHFMNGTERAAVALVSFPGTGSTWVRGLLEQATGICTGKLCHSCDDDHVTVM